MLLSSVLHDFSSFLLLCVSRAVSFLTQSRSDLHADLFTCFLCFFSNYTCHIPMEFLFVGLMGCYMFSGPLSIILVIELFNCTELTSNNNNRSDLRGPFLSDEICVLVSPKTHGYFPGCNLCVFRRQTITC